MAYVYTYTRLDKNEVFYVGIGSDSKYKRAKNKSLRTDYFKKIINKSECKLDIVFDNLSWKDACLKEIELISLYGRKDLGLGTLINFTNGGEGRLGSQNKITPIYQIDLQGNIVKEWINIKIICKTLSIDRHNLYTALNGKVLTCSKFIWVYKEKYNKKHIEEITYNVNKNKERLKNGLRKSGKIYQYDLDGNFINEFSSIKEASLKTNTRYSCICCCVNNINKRKIANNFIWKKEKIAG
jgi:hypothetical protein